MNDLDLIKKVKNAAPLDSPEFTGVPKVPTAADTTSNTQIANAEFVSNRVAAVKELLTTDIDALKTKVDNIGNIDIDSDALKEEIKTELETTLSEEIVSELSNQSVKISYDDLESRHNSVLQQVNAVIEIIDKLMAQLGESNKATLTTYKTSLQTGADNLTSDYNRAKAAYDICCSDNTQTNYSNFTSLLDTWYINSGKLLGYCQSVLNNLDGIMLGYKADATQDAIFNLLTNNGEVQGLYWANVTDEEGHTTKQLFINGEYAQLRGTKVVDLNENPTFQVTKSGQVHIHATEFTLEGKTINQTVSDAIASDSTINDAINEATGGLTTTIDNLTSKVNGIEANMGNVSDTVKEAIKDDIITEAEVNAIKKIYNDMSSRQTAVLEEIDAVLALSDITDEDRKLLNNTYRVAVVNTFNPSENNTSVTNAYNTLIIEKSVSSFNAFDSAVNTWNEAIGTARAFCQTVQQNITTERLKTKVSANRLAVFNALTDDGKIQGINMVTVTDEETGQEETQLFINGEYIKSEDFAASSSISTPELFVGKINSVTVPTMLTDSCTVYVDGSKGDDSIEFKDGAIFKTLQACVSTCPVIFNGQSVYIRLKTDVTEDIEIRGKSGGSLYIYMQNHNIYGTIKIWDCHSILIYGGDTYEEDIVESSRPSISPYNLYTYDTYQYTILATRTSYVYIKNINVFNKLTTDTDLQKKYYNIGASRGTVMNVYNVGVGNCTNGYHSIRGAHIIAQNTTGYANRYGFEARYGGMIDICTGPTLSNNAATGGKVANTYTFNNETINIADEITFTTSTLNASTNVPTSASTTSYNLTSSTGYSYRTSGSYKGSWSSQNVVRQGKFDSINGMNKGFWFFENLFDYYANLNITKIQITVTRQQAGSYGSSATMRLRWHGYRYKANATNGVSSTGVGPDLLSNWYYDVPIKALGNGATNSIILDISDSAVKDDGTQTKNNLSTMGPISAIKTGYLKGFCIYNTNGTYQQYSPSMKVTIFCK